MQTKQVWTVIVPNRAKSALQGTPTKVNKDRRREAKGRAGVQKEEMEEKKEVQIWG